MNRRAMPRFVSTITISLALALTACGNGLSAPQPPLEQAPLHGAAIGGPFALTGSDDRTVQWSDFAGQWRIVYFGYAYCPDICPTDVQRMTQGPSLYARTDPELAANIQPIFISLDPERDTPAVVGEFTNAFSDRLIGLTGTNEQIKAAADAFKVYYQRGEDTPGGGYLVDHTNITYLFDPEGNPVATLPVDLGPEAVARELARWVR